MLAASAFFGKPLELLTVRPCDVARRVLQLPVVTTRMPSSVQLKILLVPCSPTEDPAEARYNHYIPVVPVPHHSADAYKHGFCRARKLGICTGPQSRMIPCTKCRQLYHPCCLGIPDSTDDLQCGCHRIWPISLKW